MFKMSIMAAVVVFALAPVAQAVDIDINHDIVVAAGLSVGDTFQLAFVSNVSAAQWDDANADDQTSSSNIGWYDNMLQDLADNGTYNGVAALNLTWKTIGSDGSVEAKNHASLGATTPLYRLDGLQVATGYSDLWDGSIINAIQRDQNGGTPGNEILTGSKDDGSRADNNNYIGSGSNCVRGHSGATNGDWIHSDSDGSLDTNYDLNSKMYAMSEETLTVVPEPATLSLLVLGGLGVLARRRRRRA
jgi:hypothetical protein